MYKAELFEVTIDHSAEATLLSQRAWSMAASDSIGLAGWCAEEREPLVHMIEERSREKLSLQRSQLIV